MYPGTKIQLIDESRVTPIITNSTVDAASRPLYAVFFTSPRGPEKFTILEGEEWAKTYLSNNKPNFNKDGQPLLQATMNAYSGAKLFSKRIVADDATIANASLAIMVSTKAATVTTYKYYEATKGTEIADPTDEEKANAIVEHKYYKKGEEVQDPTPEQIPNLIEDGGQYYQKVETTADDADMVLDELHYYTKVKGSEIENPTEEQKATAIVETEETTDPTNKVLNIRPICISAANRASWQGDYATGKDKELYYQAAQEDIVGTSDNRAAGIVNDPDTYAYSAAEKPTTLFIQNPDSTGTGAASVAKFYTDEDATFETGKIYPVYTVFDSGRGLSDKLITFVPNYTISKSNNKMVYSLNVIDANNSGATLETHTVAIDPSLTDSKLNSLDAQSVVSGKSYLIDVKANYEAIDQLVADIAELGFSETLFAEYDMLGKRTLGGKTLPTLSTTKVDGETTYTVTIATRDIEPIAPSSMYEDTTADPTAVPKVVGNAGAWDISEALPTAISLAYGNSGSIPDMKHAKPYVAGAAYDAFYASLNDTLTGKFAMDIYNLDLYTFDCIFDANYDNKNVKDNIQKLCAYRGDCTCFMDMGFACKSLEDVRKIIEWDGVPASGGGSIAQDPKYHYFKDQAVWVTDLYYDIRNPFDGRQIKVTAPYSLSNRMVDHFIAGRERAFAGQTMGITIPEAILGTVNYIPKIYPLDTFTSEDINMTYPSDSAVIINEKQEMCDLKVNYASYYNGVLTMDTLYTTYKKDSALSYVNNIMGAQLIVKEIRKACPEITRYKFIDGNNLSKFQEDIQDRVIDKYVSMFKQLDFTYVEDPAYLENKIFYGAIRIAFRDFTQSEYFKVTVINGSLN